MSKVDERGELVKIADDGLVKLDGITISRKVIRDGKVYLQFRDSDRMRSQLRKTCFVEIPIAVLLDRIEGKSIADELVSHAPME